jgi:hypothetical protein
MSLHKKPGKKARCADRCLEPPNRGKDVVADRGRNESRVGAGAVPIWV